MAGNDSSFWEDDAKAAPAAKSGGSFWEPQEVQSRAANLKDNPTQFEKDSTAPEGNELGRFGAGAWSALKSLNPFPTSVADAKTQAAADLSPSNIAWKSLGPAGGMIHGAIDAYQDARGKGQGIIPSMGAGAAGLVGVDAAGVRDRAEKGDIAGVLGEAAVPLGMVGLGEAIHKAPAIRAAARDAMTTEEGALKPLPHAIAHTVGGAAGGGVGTLVGHPEMGAYAGYKAGPSVLKSMLGERPAPQAFRPMGPETPAEFKNPVMSHEPLELQQEVARQEEPQQSGFDFPAAKEEPQPYSASPMKRMGQLVQEQGGAPAGGMSTLEPNVSLREQRQLQKPFGNRAAVDVTEMHGPRTTAPEKLPQAIDNAVDQAMGTDPTAAAKAKASLQERYPNSGDRQQIYRTSEKVFEATRDNPKLLKALGDIPAHNNQGGPDLARAAANLGEDLGEKRIGNKKAEWMGSGQIGRAEMFDRLIDKGFTPQQIYDAAHAEPSAKPGLMRSMGGEEKRSKAGD